MSFREPFSHTDPDIQEPISVHEHENDPQNESVSRREYERNPEFGEGDREGADSSENDDPRSESEIMSDTGLEKASERFGGDPEEWSLTNCDFKGYQIVDGELYKDGESLTKSMEAHGDTGDHYAMLDALQSYPENGFVLEEFVKETDEGKQTFVTIAFADAEGLVSFVNVVRTEPVELKINKHHEEPDERPFGEEEEDPIPDNELEALISTDADAVPYEDTEAIEDESLAGVTDSNAVLESADDLNPRGHEEGIRVEEITEVEEKSFITMEQDLIEVPQPIVVLEPEIKNETSDSVIVTEQAPDVAKGDSTESIDPAKSTLEERAIEILPEIASDSEENISNEDSQTKDFEDLVVASEPTAEEPTRFIENQSSDEMVEAVSTEVRAPEVRTSVAEEIREISANTREEEMAIYTQESLPQSVVQEARVESTGTTENDLVIELIQEVPAANETTSEKQASPELKEVEEGEEVEEVKEELVEVGEQHAENMTSKELPEQAEVEERENQSSNDEIESDIANNEIQDEIYEHQAELHAILNELFAVDVLNNDAGVSNERPSVQFGSTEKNARVEQANQREKLKENVTRTETVLPWEVARGSRRSGGVQNTGGSRAAANDNDSNKGYEGPVSSRNGIRMERALAA